MQILHPFLTVQKLVVLFCWLGRVSHLLTRALPVVTSRGTLTHPQVDKRPSARSTHYQASCSLSFNTLLLSALQFLASTAVFCTILRGVSSLFLRFKLRQVNTFLHIINCSAQLSIANTDGGQRCCFIRHNLHTLNAHAHLHITELGFSIILLMIRSCLGSALHHGQTQLSLLSRPFCNCRMIARTFVLLALLAGLAAAGNKTRTASSTAIGPGRRLFSVLTSYPHCSFTLHVFRLSQKLLSTNTCTCN